MKVCKKCNLEKDLSYFQKHSIMRGGLRTFCKLCRKVEGNLYRENNKVKLQISKKIYRDCNKGRHNASNAKRRAAKIQATPKWLTKEGYKEIELFYIYARELTVATGIDWQVDHIIALLGENIRGLHVPWNLQIITKEENLIKGNRLCSAQS